MTSHSNTLSSTRPQLIPGMSFSVRICFNCRPNKPAAAEVDAIMDKSLRRANLGFCVVSVEVVLLVYPEVVIEYSELRMNKAGLFGSLCLRQE